MPRKTADWRNYQVIRDTREQQGWDFGAHAPCLGTVSGTLPTGDYTLRGYEDILAIERKGSTAEFSQNVVQDRFEREMERLEAFKYPFVVLEFTLDDLASFPANSGIPRRIWPTLRITAQFLLKRLIELEVQYRTRFILAGCQGRDYASSLFKRITETEKRPCPSAPSTMPNERAC